MRKRAIKKLFAQNKIEDVFAWRAQALTKGSKKLRRRAKAYRKHCNMTPEKLEWLKRLSRWCVQIGADHELMDHWKAWCDGVHQDGPLGPNFQVTLGPVHSIGVLYA